MGAPTPYHPQPDDGTQVSLHISDLGPDPVEEFARWVAAARDEGVALPERTILATVDGSGAPSARAVLIRDIDHGLVFYTNYHSRKGRELATNPRAAMCTAWVTLERQVRAEGTVERVDPSMSDTYWRSRPRGAQLSAVASHQSEVVEDRSVLEDAVRRLEVELDGEPIPRPESWGGYRLLPSAVEFWAGRDDRLHDRIRYRRGDQGWIKERLAP